MTRWRLHLRLLSWITTFVVLLGSMAPAISSSLAWAGNTPLPQDICSASRSNGATSAGLPDEPATANVEHCPFCLLQQFGAGLPPSVGTPTVPAGSAEAVCAHPGRDTPRSNAPWAPAAPRGPPTVLS